MNAQTAINDAHFNDNYNAVQGREVCYTFRGLSDICNAFEPAAGVSFDLHSSQKHAPVAALSNRQSIACRGVIYAGPQLIFTGR